MPKLRKYLLSFALIMLTGVAALSAQDIKESDLAPLKKDVMELHKDVFKYLEKLQLTEEGNIEIQLGLGLRTTLGGRKRFVFEEKVYIGVTKDGLSSLEFFYTQTQEKNMENARIVRYINERPQDESFSGLKLEYSSTQDEDSIFIFTEVEPRHQFRILMGYKEKLVSLVRALGVYYEQTQSMEDAGLDKVLEVGNEDSDI